MSYASEIENELVEKPTKQTSETEQINHSG